MGRKNRDTDAAGADEIALTEAEIAEAEHVDRERLTTPDGTPVSASNWVAPNEAPATISDPTGNIQRSDDNAVAAPDVADPRKAAQLAEVLKAGDKGVGVIERQAGKTEFAALCLEFEQVGLLPKGKTADLVENYDFIVGKYQAREAEKRVELAQRNSDDAA